jgi:hypothetical protein
MLGVEMYSIVLAFPLKKYSRRRKYSSVSIFLFVDNTFTASPILISDPLAS